MAFANMQLSLFDLPYELREQIYLETLPSDRRLVQKQPSGNRRTMAAFEPCYSVTTKYSRSSPTFSTKSVSSI